MSARRVELTNGDFAIVDEADYERVTSAGRWFAIQKGPFRYVCRSFGRNRRVYLHRFLTSPTGRLVVDHINGNTLDNRQANLRVVPQSLNCRNRARAQVNSKTGIMGVHPHVRGFEAKARVNGRAVHIGVFRTIEEATDARRQWERENWSAEDRTRAMLTAAEEPPHGP